MNAAKSTERWNLYLDITYQAIPWPWPGTDWEQLNSDQVAALPHAVTDFTRYSPIDGATDMTHVPADLPREIPTTQTRLAVYHDKEHVYIFIDAVRPTEPIADLADLRGEDFSCVIPLYDGSCGIYFGLNEREQAISCVQVWDVIDLPEKIRRKWPFTLLQSHPGMGPFNSTGGIIEEGYQARCIATENGLIGSFRIKKRLLAYGLKRNSFQFSAARRCFATAELMSWGSPICWLPRPDKHGTVMLVNTAKSSHRLHRLDVHYDPANESGDFIAAWEGIETAKTLTPADNHAMSFRDNITVALNGSEATIAFAPETRVSFPVPDGWNCLEVLTAIAPPVVVHFQKYSGHCLMSTRNTTGTSAQDERAPRSSRFTTGEKPKLSAINEAFRVWHRVHEQNYCGEGTWGRREAPFHCLCHDGIFSMLPYLYACRHLEHDAVYEQRIRETCARMLRHQQDAGWFPCFCADANGVNGIPEVGAGGAFTNGSVGEGLVFASALLAEPVWLAAAVRAADYSWYRWEINQNYAAFALWHLAALQEYAPDDAWIDKACYYAMFATRDIGLSGAQSGHNYYSAYGNITLKGMARLLQVLPSGHVAYEPLKELVIRFTNQMLSRQQPSGLFAGRNRWYLGYHHALPGLFYVAEALPELAPDLEPALMALVNAVITRCRLDQALSSDDGLTLALGGRFFAS